MKTLSQLIKMCKDENSPIVSELIDYIKHQGEMIQKLKDEIAEMKGQKSRPKIKPSRLDEETNKRKKKIRSQKRPGSEKKSKTKQLEIHEDKIIEPEFIPAGSVFKGYQDFIVQDIVIGNWNIRYRKARYQTPAGDYITGKISSKVSNSHFGSTLTAFILYQYYHGHVTQPLIAEQLRDYGIKISAGKINRIISERNGCYHHEKNMILSTGLELSNYVNVDDTGARHNGKNGYCTHIGNKFFAWFKSTESKSRINFLELLRASYSDYIIDTTALNYMESLKLPQGKIKKLKKNKDVRFEDQKKWLLFLKTQGITKRRHVQISTEGALLGSLISHGFNRSLVIVSDDAGQFNILQHALCWVHAERTIQKLIGFTHDRKELIKSVRSDIWDFYSELKDYQLNPNAKFKAKLNKRFDKIFKQKTGYASLDLALKRIFNNKSELLLVLKRPDIPLHNNLSENDIREYVKKRKISGSTRSLAGRKSRDTFTSIKKTCRKLGVSFWDYLIDRIEYIGRIPLLSDLMKMKIAEVQPYEFLPHTY
jgi:hypothetical protein